MQMTLSLLQIFSSYNPVLPNRETGFWDITQGTLGEGEKTVRLSGHWRSMK